MTLTICMSLRQGTRGLFSGELNGIHLEITIADKIMWAIGKKELKKKKIPAVHMTLFCSSDIELETKQERGVLISKQNKTKNNNKHPHPRENNSINWYLTSFNDMIYPHTEILMKWFSPNHPNM